MHPLTLTRPKHLLPVAGVPVIDLQLRRLADAGVRHVVLATATHADLVRDHVVSHPVDGLDVHTHDEGTPRHRRRPARRPRGARPRPGRAGRRRQRRPPHRPRPGAPVRCGARRNRRGAPRARGRRPRSLRHGRRR
ncbi:nucleotidyltransferase family protein [Janibacter hoylei]|uniref:nucleotidyltransferase family protein n=1 Tax=Janibacter hoylei TaxID=364298 RepID=UPI00389A68BF